ncbi:MAG: hypothetical protein JRJ00_00370 [Deltaproteobacteria bacterium]|nr:hypothetical protein [Deltaproteobacteria bacterium]
MKSRQQLITSLHQMSFDRIYTTEEQQEMEETWKHDIVLSQLRKIEEKYAALGTARRKEHRP